MAFPTGWSGYWEVTFDATDITAAPGIAYIPLSDAPASFWTALSASGDTTGRSIRVSDASNNLIPAYVASINTGTSTGALFCLGTGISTSVDTTYRVWGGGSASTPAATDPEGRNACFADYAGFYLPGVTLTDLTGGGRDLTAVNSPGTAASGLEGITAATYNGTSQYHKYEGTAAVTNWPITMESIAQSSSASLSQNTFSLGNSASPDTYAALVIDGADDKLKFAARGGGEGISISVSSATYSTATNYYLAGTRNANSGSTYVYVDGAQQTAHTSTLTAPTINRTAIGAIIRNTVSNYLSGQVAAAYLSSSVRSADYVATMNRMWAATTHTAGSWVPTASDSGWVLFQTAANVSGGDTAWTNVNNAKVDDSNFALAALTTRNASDYLTLTNPASITIPEDATITAVYFRIKREAPTGDIYDLDIKAVKGGGRVGNNLADIATEWTASGVTVDYGGTLLGTTWTPTDFGTNFGVAIQVLDDDSGADDARVYVVWTRVTWEDAGGNVTGTGALSGSEVAISGSGSQTNDGSGSLTAPEATLSGSSTQTNNGDGALSSGAPTVSGISSQINYGEGDLDSTLPTISGASSQENSGAGALSSTLPTISGTATGGTIATVSGYGDLVAPASEVDASGANTRAISANLNAPMPTILADADIISGDVDCTGDLDAPMPVVSADGVVGKTGTSSLSAPKPTVSGAIKQTNDGTGALVAPGDYIVSGLGYNSPPVILASGGLVGPGTYGISGLGFVIEATATPAERIDWYLSGATAEGKSQRDQRDSIGGFRSGVKLQSMTWDCNDPMIGMEILSVGAMNGRGTGTLEATDANTVRWCSPGGVFGTAVSIAKGEEKYLYDFDGNAWILVRRISDLDLSGTHPVRIIDVYNNAIGFSNVPGADAVSGEVYYRAIIGKNNFDGPMVDLKIWLDEDANSGIAIGYEAAVAGEIQSIANETTAPTGITWVTGTTSATGISASALPSGESFGLWIRKTIAADSDPSPRELVHIHVQFSDLTNTRLDDLRGQYRIARTDFVTYGLWVGQDAQPDLSAAPDEVFTTRPHTTSLSLDTDHIYYAVVRQRNKWGLWSQNIEATVLPMLADGSEGYVAPSGPSLVEIAQNGLDEPIVAGRYEPAPDGANRAHVFLLYMTTDDSTPNTAGTPTNYKFMGRKTGFGIETYKFTDTGNDLIDGTPVKAILRTRRIVELDGAPFTPDTTQLPSSGAGTIVVADEIAGWDSTGFLEVRKASGETQEIVEYSNLVVGSGISTFTVLSGGRAKWGTTAAATNQSNVIWPITYIDSANATVTEYEMDGIAPGRPWGEIIIGDIEAQAQEPVAGPDGVTEEYIDVGDNIYMLLGEGWSELWMDTVLVWRAVQDGNLSDQNRLYVPSEFDIVEGAVSGASTGVFDAVDADTLYIVSGSVRRVKIDMAGMEITIPSLTSLGDLPEVAPQQSTWEQYAGTLFQAWDPSVQDYRPFLQVQTDGTAKSQWSVDNSLTQAEIVAL